MKESILLLIIIVMLMLFAACETEVQESPAPDETEDEVATEEPQIQVGFSFGSEGDFYKQLETDIEQLCERLNYNVEIMTASGAEQQQSDIRTMVSRGAQVIIIDPVDGDALESVLAECESDDVHVVGLLREINGIYSTLISVEYSAIGEAAAERAAALFLQQEEGGRCLILRPDYTSCASQLLSDGFTGGINSNDKLTLVSEALCGSDEEEAYKVSKDKINSEGVNFIFAQNAALARGALCAVKESGKKAYIVVYGGEMDLINSVAIGEIDMAMFIGTKEIAEYSIGVANEFINSVTYEPLPYIGLTINTATSENAAGYISEGLLTAQVNKNTAQ